MHSMQVLLLGATVPDNGLYCQPEAGVEFNEVNTLRPGDVYVHWLIGPWEILTKFKLNNFPANFCDWWLRYLL